MPSLTVSVAMAIACVVAAIATTASAHPHPRGPPTYDGVIIASQFNCVDKTCTELELDISRIRLDDKHPLNETGQLIKGLIPSTPFAQMDYVIYSAYYDANRTYVVFAQQSGVPNVKVWAASIAGDGESAQLTLTTQYTFKADGDIVGTHAMLNGSVVVIFKRGEVGIFNPFSQTYQTAGNVLPSEYANGNVFTATAFDKYTNRVFAYVADEFDSNWGIATFVLATGVASAQKLLFHPRGEKEGAEIVMEAVFVNDTQEVILCLNAVSDQLG